MKWKRKVSGTGIILTTWGLWPMFVVSTYFCGKVSNPDEDPLTVIALDQLPLAQFPFSAG